MASECDRPKKKSTNAKGSSKGDHNKKGKGSKGKLNGGKGKASVNSMTKEEEEKHETKSDRSLVIDACDPKEFENEPILEALQTMIVKS
jgi:hypothetical protein